MPPGPIPVMGRACRSSRKRLPGSSTRTRPVERISDGVRAYFRRKLSIVSSDPDLLPDLLTEPYLYPRVSDSHDKKRSIFPKIRPERTRRRGILDRLRTRKQKDYVMRKLTPTLTQSGLLAVLLQRQRYQVIQLAQRRAHRRYMRAALWNTLTWPYRALTASTLIRDSA